MKSIMDPDHESVAKRNRLKTRTLISFFFGIVALLCGIVIQSHRELCCPNSPRHSILCLNSLSRNWDDVFYDLLRHDILFQIFRPWSSFMNLSEKAIYETNIFEDDRSHQRALARYHFDFVLIGDGGLIEGKDQNAFSWVTAQIINDLQVLDEAAIIQVIVTRREVSSPFGLMPYSRSTSNRNVSSGTYNENSIGKIFGKNQVHYMVDSDIRLGKVPIKDILGEISDDSAECASDPGCAVIQMVFFIPPKVAQPFFFATSLSSLLNSVALVDKRNSESGCDSQSSSRENCMYSPASGITMTGKASVVVANLGLGVPNERCMRSILSLSRSHMRELIGLSPLRIESSSEGHEKGSRLHGITNDDVLLLRSSRLRPLYLSAHAQLTAFRELRAGRSSDIRLNVDRISFKKYQLALGELLACSEMIRDAHSDSTDGSDTETSRGSGVWTRDTPSAAHAHCLAALQLSNELAIDPGFQPLSYFPLDQQLALFAPYWVPITIPLCKGVYSRVLQPYVRKWRGAAT